MISIRVGVYALATIAIASCTSRCAPDAPELSWEERYQAMDIPSTEPRTPEQAMQDFRTAPGIVVELLAAEPLIGDPVAMAWDEFGRLYVVEMRGYMQDSYGGGETEPVGRVVRLSDTDGDGEMDANEIFLDKLVNPRAIAVTNDGILIAEPPNLWLCRMPAPDSGCTDKKRVGSYGNGNPDDVEHDENRLFPALNGWLYSAKSEQKVRLRNGVLESRPTSFRGQWGMSQDALGRLYFNSNATLLMADYFPAEYYLRFRYAGLGPDAGTGLSNSLIDDQQVYSVRVNPGVNRATNDGVLRDDGRLLAATGVSGLQVYQGSQLPPAWNGHAFIPESAANLVAQLALSEKEVGSAELTAEHITYADEQWGQRDFLASTDERFRPVDARLGPDGAMYIIDMYRGIIQHRQFLTDQLRAQAEQRGLVEPIGLGRIYRIKAADAKAAEGYDFSTTEGLMAALQHVDWWPRHTAARLLAKPQHRAAVSKLDLLSLPERSQVLALLLKHNTATLLPAEVEASLDGLSALRVNALQLAADYLQADELLGWYESSGPALGKLEQLHFLAAIGQFPVSQPASQLADLIALKNIDDAHVRRIYLSSMPASSADVLQRWLDRDHDGKKEGLALLLEGIAMTAYLDARGDVSTEMANTDIERFFAVLDDQLQSAPAWQQQALLQGLATASNADQFKPVRLAKAPAFMSDQRIAAFSEPVQKSLNYAHASFTWPGDDFIAGVTPLTPVQKQHRELGRQLYPQCAACHQDDGRGAAGIAPALAGSQWVTGAPEWLVRIVLQGVTGPIEVQGETWNMMMPGHGPMKGFDDDATVAGLLTHIRRSWGNKAGPVTVEQVAQVRAMAGDRQQPWTVDELKKIQVASPFDAYAGTYKIPFMPISMDVIARADHIVLDSPQGSVSLKPDHNGVFSVEQMNMSFFFEEQGDGAMLLKLTRGKDKIDLKRK